MGNLVLHKFILGLKKLPFYLVMALLTASALIAAAGCYTPTQETLPAAQSTTETPSPGGMITPPDFECTYREEITAMECTAASLPVERERVLVKVTLPDQPEYGTAVAVAAPFPEEVVPDILAEAPQGIIALMTNFVVVPQDQASEIESAEEIRQFDPPITLQVGLTGSQLETHKSGEELFLAFWDFNKPNGEAHWVLFPQEGQEMSIAEDDAGDLFLSVTIQDWGDPLIGSGP
jgi:hypothetical protein